MKHKLASFVALGMIPFASLSLTACTNATSTQSSDPNNPSETTTVQSSPSESPVAQMDHGSMDGSMPMNHGSMSMSLGPADENFDLRFIDAMILHHRGAIEMAEEAQQKSSRPEIQQLAANIIEAQSREENELLRAWRQEWYPNASAEPVMYDEANKSTVPMTESHQQSMAMQMDLGADDEEFDLRFMNAMIPHHEGAVVMAQEALEKSSRPEVKELAQSIIDSQQQEIDQMKQWKQEWYGQ